MTDDLDLLRSLHAGDDRPSDTARASARRALDERIERERSGVRRPRRRTALAVLAACGATAAAALAITTGLDSGSVAPQSAGAALSRAAEAAASAPGYTVPRDDQFLMIRSDSIRRMEGAEENGNVYEADLRYESRTWSSVDRAGLELFRQVGPPRFPTAADRAAGVRTGTVGRVQPFEPERSDAERWSIGTRTFDAAGLRRYAPTPRELYLDARASDDPEATPTPTETAFNVLTQVLRAVPAPPRLRATAFRALAFAPGVRYEGRTRDRLGRSGVAISITPDRYRYELIFDPETAQVLSERSRLVKPGTGEGFEVTATRSDTVYLERRVVDEVPVRR